MTEHTIARVAGPLFSALWAPETVDKEGFPMAGESESESRVEIA